MELEELKLILKRLYREYVRKYLKRIILALFLSVLVAGSTSATAWLLDPAVKKIFIDQDKTLAWLIPIIYLEGLSQLVSLGYKHTIGHFFDYGGTIITESNLILRLKFYYFGLTASSLSVTVGIAFI